MISALTRLSVSAVLAVAAATALADPVPPESPKQPAPPSPVAIPYPDVPPAPSCPLPVCLPKLPPAQAARSAPAVLKLGGVEGEIEILSWSWGDAQGNDALRELARVSQATGEKGGTEDINIGVGELQEAPARDTKSKPTLSDMPVVKLSDKSSPSLASSDPQEGGEVAGKLPGLHKPSDVTLKRGTMSSSRDPASGLPTGKRVHKPMTMTNGNVVVTMPEGVCVAGAHYPLVTLTSGDQAYEMQDVTVASCTPVATAKGKKDKAKLDYMVVKMETVLISG